MTTLASGIDFIDLNFLGRPEIIATAVLQSSAGVTLIDPGPTTTLAGLERQLLERGIGFDDIRHILLTHIHLDHAGCTGALLERCPAELLVHERGAPHMIDPSKLMASATRLYGADMERLWGEMRPVPAARVRSLRGGGERIAVSGRTLEVAYTPGHAWHHVSFFDRSSGIAFVGDTAGIRRGQGTYILPATPPPDVELETWRASADLILAWEPDTLFLTHFGPCHGARQHFQELFARIAQWSEVVRRLLADPALSDEERQQHFVAAAVQDLRRTVGEAEATRYSSAGAVEYSWQGLARYWLKAIQGQKAP